MDNFAKLMQEIANTQKIISGKINETETEVESETKKQKERVKQRDKIAEDLKTLSKDLANLKFYQGKVIPYTVFKEVLISISNNLIKEVKENKLSLILSLIFLAFILLEPLTVGCTLLIIFLLIVISTTTLVSKDIYKIRKTSKISDLEDQKKSLEDKLLLTLALIADHDRKIMDLKKLREELDEKLKVLNKDYLYLEQTRNNSILNQINDNVINEAFKKIASSDIIKRVREKDKKEGK